MSNLGPNTTPASPAPGTPQTPYKAYAATAVTAVVAFIGFWVADADPFTAKDAGEGLVTALVAAGLVGGTTYGVKNKPKAVR